MHQARTILLIVVSMIGDFLIPLYHRHASCLVRFVTGKVNGNVAALVVEGSEGEIDLVYREDGGGGSAGEKVLLFTSVFRCELR